MNLSSDTITTDAAGKASFTVSTGDKNENGMDFLFISSQGVESNAVIIKTDIKQNASLKIIPEELTINWNSNPNSTAAISINPPGITNLTIHNNNPELVSMPIALSTNMLGNTVLNIIATKTGTATVTVSLSDGTVSNVLTIQIISGEQFGINAEKNELQVNESTYLSAFGGSGAYSWNCKDGLFEPDPPTTGKVKWTAPDYAGTFTISIADKEGNTRSIDIFVTADSYGFTLSKSSIIVPAQNSGIIFITGGSGTYEVTSSNPEIATAFVNNSNGTIEIHGVSKGLATVTVSDGSSQKALVNVSITHVTKAILVAGGGPYPGNTLWDTTKENTNFAYRVLIQQGYTNDTIYYLSSGTGFDLDGDSIVDGNGIASEDSDGMLTRSTVIGNQILSAADIPVIGKVTPDQTLADGKSATIFADNVTSIEGIKRVWAVITPPAFDTGSDLGIPVTNLPALEMVNVSNNRYEGTFNEFTTVGTYNIAIYAMNNKDFIAFPASTSIIQNMVFCDDSVPSAPLLDISILNTNVTISWNSVEKATGYTLFYAPPDLSYIGSIDMDNQTDISVDLPIGTTFYIAVQAYNSAGNSNYSNIVQFSVPGFQHIP